MYVITTDCENASVLRSPVTHDFLYNINIDEVSKLMLKTMYRHDTIEYKYMFLSLAATQVGIRERFFIAENDKHVTLFINPRITKLHIERVGEECCLSIGPWDKFYVPRFRMLEIQYQDKDGNSQKYFTDRAESAASIMQAMDHLDGILLDDYCYNHDAGTCLCNYVKNRPNSLSINSHQEQALKDKLSFGERYRKYKYMEQKHAVTR